MEAEGLILPKHNGAGNFDAVRWFARHFAHLQCEYMPPGETQSPRPWGISGIVVEVEGAWFLLTAGHCIDAVQEFESKGVTFRHWHLDDSAGIDAQHQQIGPFLFDNAAKTGVHVNELGIDYGLIHLRPMYQRLMEANGVVALGRSAWPTSQREFERFWLLGVPQETIEVGPTPWIMRKGVRLMELTSIERVDAPASMQEKAFPRHFFKIVSGLDDEEPPVKNIEGMSGGPIFAMRNLNGKKRYWLVGVQSGWDRTTRIVSACPADERLLQALRTAVSIVNGSRSDCFEGTENRSG